MKIPEQPGVYCLRALNSKIIYIGSTNNLQKRKNNHFSTMRYNKTDKGCKKMIDAYQAGDIVDFIIVELVNNYSEREQYWVDKAREQSEFKVINEFEAEREGSECSLEFRIKMSKVRIEKWKDPKYRQYMSAKLKQMRDNKPIKAILNLTLDGNFISEYISSKQAGNSSISTAARGKYRGKFIYKKTIWIYKQLVLFKLDELLETHQELRAISSEAWEAIKSTMNVQRLTDEDSTNNSDTSVRQPTMKDELIDDIV